MKWFSIWQIQFCAIEPKEASPKTDETCGFCGSDRRFMTSSGKTSLKDRCTVQTPARGKTCTTGAGKMIAQSVAEIISRHVRLTVEGIDRMYLNVFVPGLQYEQGIVQFFRTHRGQPLPSAALMRPVQGKLAGKVEGI